MAPGNGKVFTTGAPVIDDICTNYGHILYMSVEKSEILRDQENYYETHLQILLIMPFGNDTRRLED